MGCGWSTRTRRICLLLPLDAVVAAICVAPASLLAVEPLLLRACAEQRGPSLVVSTGMGHCSWSVTPICTTEQGSLTWSAGWLPGTVRRLTILHVWAHAVHRLSLLGALMSHHRCRRAPGAGVAIGARARLRRTSGRHEMRATTARIHHMRSAHALRPRHEVWLHHHGPSHLPVLGWHVLPIIRETPELAHLRTAGTHKHWLVVLHLRRRVHSWVGHRGVAKTGRCKGLCRV